MTREHNKGNARSRRSFLKGAVGVGGGVAAVSFAGAFGIDTADAAANDVATILNLAATAEALAVTFYHTVLANATFHIDAEDAEYLKLTMAAEIHHLQILQSLGGAPRTRHFYLPARVLADASVFVGMGLKAEAIFAGAYLAATHQFAALGQPTLAATAAQHGASEAQHLALITHLAGLGPSARTLPEPLFLHVSDAALALKPFLHGGDGFTLAAQLPTPDQYHATLDGTVAIRTLPFAQAHGAALGS